ncbi:hypothetical protein GCM10011322_45380 [Salinarimonas ramus]|uniref:Uncharacterized protein n=1 Tax=Salinarimonas ramus TaxID=690164 RepID=A0A917QKD3_9HYPH|nr:hypothetical protein GCM10011322_45380 [Salinarimonas ramus]
MASANQANTLPTTRFTPLNARINPATTCTASLPRDAASRVVPSLARTLPASVVRAVRNRASPHAPCL